MNNKLKPEEWSWKKKGDVLEPVYTLDELIPPNLMKKFHCGCKSKCLKRCGCRKLGLKCNKFCKTCNGSKCLNCDQLEEVDIDLDNDQVYVNDSLSLQVDSPINLRDREDDENVENELVQPECNDDDDDDDDDVTTLSSAKKRARLT